MPRRWPPIWRRCAGSSRVSARVDGDAQAEPDGRALRLRRSARQVPRWW